MNQEINKLSAMTSEISINNMIEIVLQSVKAKGHESAIIEHYTGYTCFHSGSSYPLFNGAFVTGQIEGNSNDHILSVNDFFKNKNVPFTWWWLQQCEIPLEFKEALDKFGYQSIGSYSGIALNIDKLNSQDFTSQIEIKKVATHAEYQIFINILSDVFSLDENSKGDFSQMMALDKNHDNLNHYLGFLNDKPVSILTSYFDKQKKVVGLYNGATLPEARRKNIFSQLMHQALYDAKKSGFQLAVGQLMADGMAKNICSKLGFVECCKMLPFIKL